MKPSRIAANDPVGYSIDADEEFLRVRIWGREADEPPSHVCAAVYQASRQLGRSKILIELDQKRALSPTSQAMLVSSLPQIGFTREDRIALVHGTEELQRHNDFINVLAFNRGVMLRNFPSLAAAEAWLRAPAP